LTDPARWVPPRLPDDPREVRKIRNQLIVLALLTVIAMIVSMVAR